MPNQTAVKFGHPDTLVADYRHWCVLLRPGQVTLGSLVLVCKDAALRFSDITPDAFAELARATRDIETGLAAFRPYDRINYLMLMMVDPHVHWHVIPRYEGEREAEGMKIADAGWPKLPQLGEALALDEAQVARLGERLRAFWPGGARG